MPYWRQNEQLTRHRPISHSRHSPSHEQAAVIKLERLISPTGFIVVDDWQASAFASPSFSRAAFRAAQTKSAFSLARFGHDSPGRLDITVPVLMHGRAKGLMSADGFGWLGLQKYQTAAFTFAFRHIFIRRLLFWLFTDQSAYYRISLRSSRGPLPIQQWLSAFGATWGQSLSCT